MARARNIKPATFKNEKLGEADPMVMLLFIGLWTLADREGRLEDRPKRIKAELFPYRENIDVNGYLTELERLEFICRYTVGNQQIIQVETFCEHQNPHRTEKESRLPERPENSTSQDSTVKEPLNNGTITDIARLIPDSLNTDSLLLIPDSGSSDSAATASLDDAADFLKRLIEVHGYDERQTRTKTKNTTQARQWLADEVTAQELDDAVEISRERLRMSNDDRDPPIAYLAKVLASNRKNPEPVKSGINVHSGFTPERYQVDEETSSRFDVVGGAK